MVLAKSQRRLALVVLNRAGHWHRQRAFTNADVVSTTISQLALARRSEIGDLYHRSAGERISRVNGSKHVAGGIAPSFVA